jgi:hypothetical protein
MGARVVQVFAFEPDLGAAPALRQPLGEIERRRPADEPLEQFVQLSIDGLGGSRVRAAPLSWRQASDIRRAEGVSPPCLLAARLIVA